MRDLKLFETKITNKKTSVVYLIILYTESCRAVASEAFALWGMEGGHNGRGFWGLGKCYFI